MIEPVAFEQKNPKTITIGWSDGRVTDIDAHRLRLSCPCASCIDEITGEPLLDPQAVPADVTILDADLVGRYAFRFRFSDRHDTGIFTFELLRQLAGV